MNQPASTTGSSQSPTRRARTALILALAGLTLVALCLAALLVLRGAGWRYTSPAQPLLSTSGQLAFISDRDGLRQLYLMEADGSHPTRLTYTDKDIWQAAWSPDGRYLAFVQGTGDQADVYLQDVEAVLEQAGPVAPLRLTEQSGFDGYPAWSPDGASLAFGSEALIPRGTYLVDVADFLAAPVWSEPGLLAAFLGYPAAWSPDGAFLAVEGTQSVSIVSADGSREVPLGEGRRLSWAPDGRQVVFGRGGDLYRANADGTGLLRLTDTPGDEYGPAWSPDGRQIAYLWRAPNNSDLGQPYIMPAPGTQGPRPTWGSQGGQVNADGSDQQPLHSMGADELAWSPDSTRLAFYSNRGRRPGVNGEIWVMNRDGTGLTPLTDHPAWDGWPSWRPRAASPALERVPQAKASLEAIKALAEGGVRRNADWTPYLHEFGGLSMALVPAGCFRMGRDADDIAAALQRCRQADPACGPPAGLEDQSPAHQICFDRPFWISVTEVTVAQLREYGEKGECGNDREGDQHPCQGMTWFGAAAFCARYGLRLPSEAEWEYAARGPDGLLFPWGNDFAADRLVWGAVGAADVGSLPAGAAWVGALDMLGNAWEWTGSWYALYPYDPADGRESEGGDYQQRALRGQDWEAGAQSLWQATIWSAATRTAARPAAKPAPSYGFRCARFYK
jgi:formylglycine-generating enzyme required for sulfatase activity/Tol biopolymer transport system component